MKKIIYKADSRGKADYGWLKPAYSFSFASYYNPERVHFGMLRVLNDDWVAPGAGFDTHPHDNMEITTIPLSGALEHRDSMGSAEVLRAGEIQVMSAGTGITHSEYNHSKTDPLTLLQVWIFPKTENVQPRYEQRAFDFTKEPDKMHEVVTPERAQGKLWLHQDAWFSLGRFENETEFSYTLHDPSHGVFTFVIEGSVKVDDISLSRRDAAGIYDTSVLNYKATASSYILLIEVPMR